MELGQITPFSGTVDVTKDFVVGVNKDSVDADYLYNIEDIAGPLLTDGSYTNCNLTVVDGRITAIASGGAVAPAGSIYTPAISAGGTLLPPVSVGVNGCYSVGGVVTLLAAGGGAAVTLNVNYTDENNIATSKQIVTISAANTQSVASPVIIYAKAGTTITVISAISTGTATYNAAAFVTKIF